MTSYILQKIKNLFLLFSCPDPYSSEKQLLVREWLAIAVISGGMLGLVFASKLPEYAKNYLRSRSFPESGLDVSINGCVQMPGTYQVDQNSKVKDLIELARLTPEANIKNKNIEAKLHQGQRVHIAKQRKKVK